MADSVKDNDTLGSLEAALREALNDKVMAEKDESDARSRVSRATNLANDLRKKIISHLDALGKMPGARGTDLVKIKWEPCDD